MTGERLAGMTRPDYMRHRDRQIAYGRWEPFVPADRARGHVRWLSSCGVGWEQAATLAGVPKGTVSKLLYGAGGTPPSRRIRPETEAAILAVRPALDVVDGRTIVDGTGTRRRLQALARCGWPMSRLSARLDGPGRQLDTILRRDARVRAATARAVRVLYDDLWDQAPPEETREDRAAAAYARNRARKQGWVPPLAWDDDEIDDPAAVPARGWRRSERHPVASPVGAAIRSAREQAAMSRPQLAAVVGVTASAVQWWERGMGIPGEEHWIQLELTLGPLGVVRDAGPEGAEETEAA